MQTILNGFITHLRLFAWLYYGILFSELTRDGAFGQIDSRNIFRMYLEWSCRIFGIWLQDYIPNFAPEWILNQAFQLGA